MKPNPDKFHILLSNTVCQRIDVCNESIENSRYEKTIRRKN